MLISSTSLVPSYYFHPVTGTITPSFKNTLTKLGFTARVLSEQQEYMKGNYRDPYQIEVVWKLMEKECFHKELDCWKKENTYYLPPLRMTHLEKYLDDLDAFHTPSFPVKSPNLDAILQPDIPETLPERLYGLKKAQELGYEFSTLWVLVENEEEIKNIQESITTSRVTETGMQVKFILKKREDSSEKSMGDLAASIPHKFALITHPDLEVASQRIARTVLKAYAQYAGLVSLSMGKWKEKIKSRGYIEEWGSTERATEIWMRRHLNYIAHEVQQEFTTLKQKKPQGIPLLTIFAIFLLARFFFFATARR